jgi:hypothetical protein
MRKIVTTAAVTSTMAVTPLVSTLPARVPSLIRKHARPLRVIVPETMQKQTVRPTSVVNNKFHYKPPIQKQCLRKLMFTSLSKNDLPRYKFRLSNRIIHQIVPLFNPDFITNLLQSPSEKEKTLTTAKTNIPRDLEVTELEAQMSQAMRNAIDVCSVQHYFPMMVYNELTGLAELFTRMWDYLIYVVSVNATCKYKLSLASENSVCVSPPLLVY